MISFRTFLEFLLHFWLLIYSSFASNQYSLRTDKAALLEFKNTIVSDPNPVLSNWNDSVHVCNFTGITCSHNLDRVEQLNLPKTDLSGPLSPVISNLSGLQVLNLAYNNFYGSLPSEFSSLQNLQHLQLDMNSLEGSIPETFAFSHLTLLTIMNNKLTGSIPASLFSNCTSLGNIDLSNNFLTGKIPEEIGNSPNLWTINLYNNQLTGNLPASLINTSLFNIDVEDNHLSGELPTNIVGKLSTLVMLHLSYNQMVSHDHNTNLEPFFSALGNCPGLEELELAGMGLGGKLPINFRNLQNVVEFDISSNKLTGIISPELSNLKEIKIANFANNYFVGSLPSLMGSLGNLEALDCSGNRLTGIIPTSLSKIESLRYLNLSFNSFEGKIPTGGIFDTVTHKSFLGNPHLCGSIPGISSCNKIGF